MANPPPIRSIQELWRSTPNNRVTIFIIERDFSIIVPTYWTALLHSHATNPMAGVVSPIHVTRSVLMNLEQAGLSACSVVFYVNENDLNGIHLPPNVRATFCLQRLFQQDDSTVGRLRFTNYEMMVKEALTTRMHNLGACTPYVWAEIIRHPRAVPNIFLKLATHLPRHIFRWNAVMCMDILYRNLTTPADLPQHLGIPTFSNHTNPIAQIGSANLCVDLNFPPPVWSRMLNMSQLARAPCPLPAHRVQHILNQQPNAAPVILRSPLNFELPGPSPMVRPVMIGIPPQLQPLNLSLRARAPVAPEPIQRPIAVVQPTPGPSRQPLPPGTESPSLLAPENVEPYVPEMVPGPSQPSSGGSTRFSEESQYQLLLDSSDSEDEEGEIRETPTPRAQHSRRNKQNQLIPGPGFNPYHLRPAADLRQVGFDNASRPANMGPGGFIPVGFNRHRFVHPTHPFRDTKRLCFKCWRRGHKKSQCRRPRRY